MPNINHADYLPSFKKDAVEDANETWASGLTKTISNKHVKATSRILIAHTSAHNGRWYISAIEDGSFTITTSDAESGATFKYVIL